MLSLYYIHFFGAIDGFRFSVLVETFIGTLNNFLKSFEIPHFKYAWKFWKSFYLKVKVAL